MRSPEEAGPQAIHSQPSRIYEVRFAEGFPPRMNRWLTGVLGE